MADNSKNWRYFLNRWISGAATRSDERSLEALAKEDPFLADALEGYRNRPEADHARSVTKLKADLRKRTGKKQNKRTVFYLARIAAAGVLLLGAWLVFRSFDGNEKTMGLVDEAAKTGKEKTENLASNSKIIDLNKNTNDETATSEPIGLNKKTDEKPEYTANISLKKESPAPAPPAVKIAPPPPKTEAGPGANKPQVAKDEGFASANKRADNAYAPTAGLAEKRKMTAAENKETESLATAGETAKEAKAMPAPRDEAARYFTDGIKAGDKAAAPAPQTIKGRITDKYGDPLIAANVVVKGTGQGTVTDLDGHFTIQSPSQNPELLVSYTGYDTQRVQVKGDRFMEIELEEGAELSEVAVTKLGRKKKAKKPKAPVYKPKVGFKKYKKYIQENLHKPQVAIDSNIMGKVVLTFKIDDTGTPYNFEILRSLGHGCEEEAIRLLKNGPKWNKPTEKRQAYSLEFK
ncbi:MAG TPA: hypothetical protein ENJ95_07205 [Bacteroidetes bacterium]|nr:hypothetical protein [Bacteroidota bacterium]